MTIKTTILFTLISFVACSSAQLTPTQAAQIRHRIRELGKQVSGPIGERIIALQHMIRATPPHAPQQLSFRPRL